MAKSFTRRGMLKAGLGTACSVAAHPLLSTVALAAAPWDARLVVIILRGGVDGLHLLPPMGDPNYAGLRPGLAKAAAKSAVALTDFYALHGSCAKLKPLWDGGELGFVQAVSTPYRDGRSHFDGQDILEAGTGGAGLDAGVRDGWLNRLVGSVPGATAETAYAVGKGEMKLLLGPAPTLSWAPDFDIELTPQAELLLHELYAGDPLFQSSADAAIKIAREFDREKLPKLSTGAKQEPLAAFAAGRLKEETRIAAFSLNGWDTHRNQQPGLSRAADRLARSILTLQEGLGPVWQKTAVLAMTEFGRTAAENGSKGTDHGTGGMMVLAGGALRGGKVHGDWPGLDEADLYKRRDLMPTADVRGYAAWAMRGLFGIGRDVLEGTVFPGLDMGRDPGVVA